MSEQHEKKDVSKQQAALKEAKSDAQETLNFHTKIRRFDSEIDKDRILAENEKVVHFIRHGEGFHNKAQREWRQKPDYDGKTDPYQYPLDQALKYMDPELTPVGLKQAQDLNSVTRALKVEVVITSPLRRAIQTAVHGLEDVLKTGCSFIAEELCHEIGGFHTCDKRLNLTELKKQFPTVNFDGVKDEEDPLWLDGYTRETWKELAIRSAKFVNYLQQRKEKHLAVTSHSSILLAKFNATLVSEDESLQRWFATGELRSVVLEFTPKT